MPAEATTTGHCDRGDHAKCRGVLTHGTGWNWWCTCSCHPEPPVPQPEQQPALDLWRKSRALGAPEATEKGRDSDA
jgi:hypothetical protein